MPCCWYRVVTGLSNLASTSKLPDGVGCSRRGTESAPVQMSCAVPAGTEISASVPLADAVASASGFTKVQKLVSSPAPLNSSDESALGQADVVKVWSGDDAVFPLGSAEPTWKWY